MWLDGKFFLEDYIMSAFSIEKYDGLFDAVLSLSSLEEARLFFEDICTIKELEAISQRLEVARMLKGGGDTPR